MGVTFNYDFEYDADFSQNYGDAIVDHVTVTGPEGFLRTIEVTNTAQGSNGCNVGNANVCTLSVSPPRKRIDSVTDSQGQVTSYTYGPNERLLRITYPELNAVEVVYDLSGNISERRTIPKPGSGLATLYEYAEYNDALGCGSVSCFLPIWTKDANGNQTDYTWASHGGILTQLAPADENGIRA